MLGILAASSIPYDRKEYFENMKNFHRHHWDHVGHRIIGKPVVLIPRHTGILIVFRLITASFLLIAICFTLVGFSNSKIISDASRDKFHDPHQRPGDPEILVKADSVGLLKEETTWDEVKKVGDLALIGFVFIIATQALVALIVLWGVCYRCWKLKRPTRTWEVMPFCIGSTLLFLAGALECYYATSFKKLDDELVHDIKEAWLAAAILTLISAMLGIADTCMLLGSEARILSGTFIEVEQSKALMAEE